MDRSHRGQVAGAVAGEISAGNRALRGGKFGEAAEELNRLVDAVQREENPYFGQALLLLGESLRETGDLEGGARRFDQAARDGGGAVAAEALFRLVYLPVACIVDE